MKDTKITNTVTPPEAGPVPVNAVALSASVAAGPVETRAENAAPREEKAPPPEKLAKAPIPSVPAISLATEDSSPLQQKKNADHAYHEAVGLASELVNDIKENGSLSLDAVQHLQQELLSLYTRHDGSLLLENLLISRINQQYYPHHAVNVALLNSMVATAMGLAADQLPRLVKIGIVIDFGMLRLPASLTDTTRVFTEAERQRIWQHTEATVEMMTAAGETDTVLVNAIRLHHERVNGTGYPQGLKGGDIPLEARITAVSDSFDAATSRKAYRTQKSPFQMLAEFSENPGGALDSAITKSAVSYLASLLVGRHVVLADHSVGQVVDVDPQNLAYPLVRVVGKLIQTGPELPTVMLSSFMPIH